MDHASLLDKLPVWSLWTLEQTSYLGWENISRPMITATVDVQCTVQTTGSENRDPGYYLKTHLAQSWQDNLFLWVQSRLECCCYDLLKESKKKVQLSKGTISCSLCRQSSSRLQRECCPRGKCWTKPLEGIISPIMLPSTFGGWGKCKESRSKFKQMKKEVRKSLEICLQKPSEFQEKHFISGTS